MAIPVLTKIKEQIESMYLAERKVAEIVLNNPQKIIKMNVTELAELSDVSDATVVRLCKRLGYTGFTQMKIYLAEELGRNQMAGYQDAKDNPQNAKDVIRCLTRDLLRIADFIDEERIRKCIELICTSKRVFISAVGNTIPVAMDFAYRLSRLGINASCGTIVEYGIASIASGSEEDLLIAISHSGSSRHVIQAVEIANEKKMSTIAVTGSSSSIVARMVQHSLLTTVENPLFDEFGATSHIYEQAILDSLLYFVSIQKKQEPEKESIEAILASYKI